MLSRNISARAFILSTIRILGAHADAVANADAVACADTVACADNYEAEAGSLSEYFLNTSIISGKYQSRSARFSRPKFSPLPILA